METIIITVVRTDERGLVTGVESAEYAESCFYTESHTFTQCLDTLRDRLGGEHHK